MDLEERQWPSPLKLTEADVELIRAEAARNGVRIPETYQGIADFLGKMAADRDFNG